MDRLDNTPRQHAKSDGAHATPNLWRTKAQVCSDLDISPRTLNRRVQAGQIERRKVGNKALYRAAESPVSSKGHFGPCLTRPLRHHATPVAPQSTGGLAIAGVHAIERAPSTDASPDLATLTALVQQLSSDLAQASQDKGEAIGIGWTLAEQREQLTAELARLQRAVYEVADSPLALPVRRRIMQILRSSLH
jgi:hypothetical protein